MNIKIDDKAYKNAEILFLQEDPEIGDGNIVNSVLQYYIVNKILRYYVESIIGYRAKELKKINAKINVNQVIIDSSDSTEQERESAKRRMFLYKQEYEQLKNKIDNADERLVFEDGWKNGN